MNDRTIEDIKNNFYNISKAFEGVEGEELTYQRLKELATENLTPTEMLEKLRQIGESKSFDPPINNFFFQAYEHLKSLASQEKKKDELTKELKQEHGEYQERIAEKGLKPTADTHGIEFQYKDNANYQTMDKTNDDIQTNIDLLDKRLDELGGVRTTGKPLEEMPTDTYNKVEGIKEKPDNPNENIDEMNSEFNKINEQVMKINNHPDPSADKMYIIYHSIADQQTADTLLNVDIKYNADNVEVVLTLEGTNIDETIGKTVCTFSDIEYFNTNILEQVFVEEHTSGGLKEETILDENGDLKSINSCDETLSISGNKDISSETAEKLNKKMKLQKNNSSSMQRKRVIGNRGYNLINIYIAIVVLLVLVAVASFIYLIIFKK